MPTFDAVGAHRGLTMVIIIITYKPAFGPRCLSSSSLLPLQGMWISCTRVSGSWASSQTLRWTRWSRLLLWRASAPTSLRTSCCASWAWRWVGLGPGRACVYPCGTAGSGFSTPSSLTHGWCHQRRHRAARVVKHSATGLRLYQLYQLTGWWCCLRCCWQVCADTIVGNDMRRRVSGGQRKRVTTGEVSRELCCGVCRWQQWSLQPCYACTLTYDSCSSARGRLAGRVAAS